MKLIRLNKSPKTGDVLINNKGKKCILTFECYTGMFRLTDLEGYLYAESFTSIEDVLKTCNIIDFISKENLELVEKGV